MKKQELIQKGKMSQCRLFFSLFGIIVLASFLLYLWLAEKKPLPEIYAPEDKTENMPQEKSLSVVALLQKRAEAGESEAQNELALLYDKGDGVEQDFSKALDLYRKAADQGLVYAQYNLAHLYYEGHGVNQDFTAARHWFQKAAEQGYAGAQSMLGRIYDRGEGVEKDLAAAFQWYKKAAEQGHAVAQYNLGDMYHRGQGIAQNDTEAYVWYQEAAAQGYEKGQEALYYLQLLLGPTVHPAPEMDPPPQ